MIVNPTTKQLLQKATNQFELVIIISKRARQLVKGESPLIKTDEMLPITIASLEFNESKYNVIHKKHN